MLAVLNKTRQVISRVLHGRDAEPNLKWGVGQKQ